MTQLTVKALVAIALAVLVVTIIVALFTNLFPLAFDPNRAFAEGCFRYCEDISRQASAGGDISAIAIQEARQLENSTFVKACKLLYPDVVYPWECWNRNCCTFAYR